MKAIELDSVDQQILEMLRLDGRCSNAEIARKLELSEGTIRRRLNEMLQSGVTRITAALNPLAVGYEVQVMISLKVLPGKGASVADEIAEYNEVNYVGQLAGHSDILVQAFFLDNDHVLNFINNELAKIDGIRDVQTSYVLRVVKRTNHWIPVGFHGGPFIYPNSDTSESAT